MAGRPILRATLANLCRLGRAAGLDQVEANQPELTEEEVAAAYVLAWIIDGGTFYSLAKQLGVSRALISNWMNSDTDREKSVVNAREASAHSHVEMGLHLIDTADRDDIQVANARASYRKWYAGMLNRRDYGTQAAPSQAISIGTMHLHAVQAFKDQLRLANPIPEVQHSSDTRHNFGDVGEELAQVLGYE
jgi:hypothetical protein